MEKPKIDFTMASLAPGNSSLALQVSVQGISISDGEVSSLVTKPGGTGFKAVIDSTLPYFYLPPSVCDTFAEMVGLQFDNETGLYTINATQRAAMAGKSIVFLVSDVIQGLTKSTSITLPIAAFDLNASWPVYDNSTPYFPIRKSLSGGEDPNGLHILGRTFLQEAYIIADFDRANFTIANAIPGILGTENIVTIMKPTTNSSKPNVGKLAGIIVGVVVPVTIFLILFLWWWRRKYSRKPEVPEKDSTAGTQSDQITSWRNSTLSGDTETEQRHELSLEPVHEAPDSTIRHEVEDKSDATAWALNQRQQQQRVSATPSELQGDIPGWYVRSRTPSHVRVGSSPNSLTTFGTPPNTQIGFSPPTSPIPPTSPELSTHEESPAETDLAEAVGRAEMTSMADQGGGDGVVEVGGTLEPEPPEHISRYERIRRILLNSASTSVSAKKS